MVGMRLLLDLMNAVIKFHGRESSDMNRSVWMGIGMAAMAASLGFAQGPANQPFVTHQLAANVYWVEGGGGNSGVIVGDKGVIVIDAKTSAAGGKELLEDVAKITPKPVVAVIETHSDGDHVNGLASFPMGLRIIAHENNKKEQEAALAAGGGMAPPKDHLPTEVVTKNKEEVTIEGVKLELLHWAPAHTSGDLVIYLPKEKIVFGGDILALNQPVALIHLEKHGSSAGWITSVKGMIALDSNVYVPGHGDVATKAVVEEKLDKAVKERAQIADLIKQGKTLQQIEVAVGDPPPAAAGGGGGPRFAPYSEVVYKELTQPVL